MKTVQLLLLLTCLLTISCSLIHLTPSKKIHHIDFTQDTTNEQFSFIYPDNENSPELTKIKSLYFLDSVVRTGDSSFGQMLALLKWTNGRWQHSGSNEPSNPGALTILKEAETGKKFRCVEYAIVLKSVLAANGFNARTLALKTKDAEIVRLGAGHLVTEVWSDLYNKWFMLDAQFNIVPTINDQPLNAVEFQNAIIQKRDFKLMDADGEVSTRRRKKYLNFIPHYLYYFDLQFDQREVAYPRLFKVNEKASLMLVPNGARKPVVFQRKFELNDILYTSSLMDFYRKPN